MSGKQWTLGEESFVRDNAGEMSVADMAESLGRTYASVRSHIQYMRLTGRFDKPLSIKADESWHPNLRVCESCQTPRSKFARDGTCAVCAKGSSLEEHRRRMVMAWDNLPPELQARTNGTFDIERNYKLMGSKSREMSRPKVPDTSHMSGFEAGKAMDAYYRELEEYELARLTLDIDAVKQRRSKWTRKAAAWRSKHGIEDA